jgi:hypothetical protein
MSKHTSIDLTVIKTHSDITNAGTLQAVSECIFSQKMNATSPSTALDDFFGTGMTIFFFY